MQKQYLPHSSYRFETNDFINMKQNLSKNFIISNNLLNYTEFIELQLKLKLFYVYGEGSQFFCQNKNGETLFIKTPNTKIKILDDAVEKTFNDLRYRPQHNAPLNE